jgi:hypothetical protein
VGELKKNTETVNLEIDRFKLAAQAWMAQQIVKVKNLKNSIFGDIVFC